MKSSIKKCLTVCALTCLVFTAALAQSDQSTKIKQLIAPKLGKNTKVDAVTKTPYAGLYEVQVGGDIFYTDDKANYLFVGNIVDLSTQKNLTKAKVDEINKVKISELPLNLAFKQVKGNGKRVLAIFEDPNCGYCKKLRKELQKVDNVTIYTFMYDILSEDSATKSKNVWCSGDPVTAWNDLMINGKEAPEAPATCMTNPHQQILDLGRKLHINATPAIILADGTRVLGYVDAPTLEKRMSEVK